MINIIIKCLIIVMLIFTSGTLFGADYYVAESATGSGDGSSCAHANAVADLNWSSHVGAGGTLHLCGTLTTAIDVGVSGTDAGHPTTVKFEDGAKYSMATWGGTYNDYRNARIKVISKQYILIDGGTNGIIEATGNGTELATQHNLYGIRVDSANNIEVKNLTIKNLYQRTGTSTDGGGYAIHFTSGIHDTIRIHDCVFDWMAYGVNVVGIFTNFYGYNNTFSNINIGYNLGAAQAATIDGVYIYNNTFGSFGVWDDTTDGNAFHHNGIHIWLTYSTLPAWVASTAKTAGAYVVASNNSSYYYEAQGGGTTGTTEPVWPTSAGTVVDNDITWAYVGPAGTIKNMDIYNNYVYGPFGTRATSALSFVECRVGICDDVNIFNNVIYATDATYPANAFITAGKNIYNNTIVGQGSGYAFGGGSNVYNNIVYNLDRIINETCSASGLYVCMGAGRTQSDYNNAYSLNNATCVNYMRYAYSEASTGWGNCEQVTSSGGGTANFFRKDISGSTIELRNMTRRFLSGETITGSEGRTAVLSDNGTKYEINAMSYADWQTYTCQDTHSTTGDPAFVNAASDWNLTASSTDCIDKGKDGSAVLGTSLDKAGSTRSAIWDIGAYEYDSGTTYPSATIGSGASMSIGSGAVMTLQ